MGSTAGSAHISWPTPQQHGDVSVLITLADGHTAVRSVCVTTKPKPQGGFTIVGEQTPIFCSHNEIFFENNAFVPDGSQIVASQWNFGDGTSSNAENPSHTYTTPGTYIITLTVYDECGCSNTWEKKIEVTKPGLQISCPTVVCEGAIETYSVEDLGGHPAHCNQYNWTVDGGHILQQSDNWVTVVWNHVDDNGFGYIYFDQSQCVEGCNNLLVAKVPVITAKTAIKGGKQTLCKGEQSRYAIPQWPTTAVDWSVVSVNNPNNPLPNATTLTDQRNEVVVNSGVLAPGDYFLKAAYTNTLLDCGGHAQFKFTVLPNLEIDLNHLPDEVCQGDNVDFYLAQPHAGATWTISKNNQTIATLPGSGPQSHAQYQFTQPGYYSITATAPGTCPASGHTNVIEIPDVSNATISGNQEVCPGVGETYTFNGSTQGFNVQWSVDHGSFLGPDKGQSVKIKFEDGTYTQYQVTATLVNPDHPNCASDPVTYVVHRFAPNAQIVKTTPGSFICTSSIDSFKVAGYNADYYEWSIEPEQLAHVSSGQGSQSVAIDFNEPYQGQTQGVIKVRAKVCGTMQPIATYNFDVVPHPTLSIVNAPNGVCPNDNFQITFSSTPTVPANSVSIHFDNANLIGNPNVTYNPNTQIYTISNINLPNADPYHTATLAYTISTSGVGVCGSGQISGTLQRFPAPRIVISHTGADVFCHAYDINTVFTASIQGAGVLSNTIQWYHDGTPVGTTGSTTLDVGALPASVGGFGSYYATATNSDGCTSTSTNFYIAQDCTPPPPPCSGESVTASAEWTDCHHITLTGNYTSNNAPPISLSFLKNAGFTYNHAQGMTATDNGSQYVQEFKVDAPGTYRFVFKAVYPTCTLIDTANVVVYYQAHMNKTVQCMTNGYQLTFVNKSNYFSGSPHYVDYTVKKLPNSPTITPNTSNSNQAIYNNLGEGDYKLTLTVDGPGAQPPCHKTDTIHLHKPDASFTLPTEVCTEDIVHLHPTNPTPGATYLWEYQQATNTMQSFSPTLSETGGAPTTIYLTVTTPYGCSVTSSESITVYKADFGGKVTASPGDICEGQDVTLNCQSAPNNPNSPVEYKWHNAGGVLGTTTTSTFTVNSAAEGEYWVILKGLHGCKDKTAQSVHVNFIPPPDLSADITGSICAGEDIRLTGSLSPDNTSFKISRKKNGGSYTVVQGWTTGPDINFTDPAMSVGHYTYKVDYKAPPQNCSGVSYFTATVHPVPVLNAQVQSVQCMPYRVVLTASANQPGHFVWSNGMSGAQITVDHGGPYRVRFFPQGSNCVVTQTIHAPKSPAIYTWIFPTGCYTYCPVRGKYPPYIIGPLPYFNGYAYGLDGQPLSTYTGTGIVPDFPIWNQQGNLTLTLDNGYCTVTTDPLDMEIAKACEQPCHIGFRNVQAKLIQEQPYLVYNLGQGAIINGYNMPVVLHLQSPDGAFIPANIPIPANGVYDLGNNNILFYPFNTPPNSPITINYTVSIYQDGKNVIICQDQFTMAIPQPLPAHKTDGFVSMRVVPNPTQNQTKVSYQVKRLPGFKQGKLLLYTIQGQLMQTRRVDKREGTKTVDLTGYPSGSYILVFIHNGHHLGQQIIIKK